MTTAGKLIFFSLAAGFFLLVGAAVRAFRRSREESLLASFDRRVRVGGATGAIDLARAARLGEAQGLAALVQRLPGAEALERLLIQADQDLTVPALLVRCLVSGAAGGLGLGLLFRTPAGVLLGLVIAAPAPILLILRARGKRSELISRQLPEALEMITRSLQAGHPLEAAMEVVANEVPEPLGKEFIKCREEQRLGRSFEDAIVALAARVPGNMELRIFAVAATVLRETGGNLVQVLDKLGATLRERDLFRQKVRTLTADSRASGQILAGLPLAMMLLVVVANPRYLSGFVSDPLGVKMALTGIVLWLLGVFFLRRMSQVRL